MKRLCFHDLIHTYSKLVFAHGRYVPQMLAYSSDSNTIGFIPFDMVAQRRMGKTQLTAYLCIHTIFSLMYFLFSIDLRANEDLG